MSATSEAVAAFEAQGVLEPGTEGWWKVWGAQVHHVQAGDLVGSLVDGEMDWFLVEELFEAKAAPLRQGFVTDGERTTLGVLCPIVLLRRGTHNVLA